VDLQQHQLVEAPKDDEFLEILAMHEPLDCVPHDDAIESHKASQNMSTVASAVEFPSEAWFGTTHWSVVLSARDKASPQSEVALEQLCRAYWCPLYAYVRRRGHSPHDAEDLTQEFLSRLVHKDYLDAVHQERGRFRTFLMMAIRRHLSDAWDRARAQKRGGGSRDLSLDATAAEQKYLAEAVEEVTPETLYERHWALTLLDRTMRRLRREYVAAGKAGAFDELRVFLTEIKGTISHAEAARRLGLSEGAVRVAVHRLRKRFRELFREEIAQTVGSPDDIDGEIRYLLGTLSA